MDAYPFPGAAGRRLVTNWSVCLAWAHTPSIGTPRPSGLIRGQEGNNDYETSFEKMSGMWRAGDSESHRAHSAVGRRALPFRKRPSARLYTMWPRVARSRRVAGDRKDHSRASATYEISEGAGVLTRIPAEIVTKKP